MLNINRPKFLAHILERLNIMNLDSKLSWWQYRREDLLEVVKEQCPILVWDDESINEMFFGVLLIEGVSQIFHSIRVNGNPRVIEKVFRLGAGFRCERKQDFDMVKSSINSKQEVPVLSVSDETRRGELVIRTNFPVPGNEKAKNRHGEQDWEDHIFLKIQIPDHGIYHNVKHAKGVFKGLYVAPSAYDQAPSTIQQLKGVLKRFLPYTKDDTPVIILNRQVGLDLDQQEKCPDMEQTRIKIEGLKNFFPHIEIWLDPEEFIFAHTGALFVTVARVVNRPGANYAEVNLGAEIFHALQEIPQQVYGINFLSMQKLGKPPVMLVPYEVAGRPFIDPIPCYSELKKGHIVILPNTGMLPARLNDIGPEIKPAINYHYMCARRICQVKL